MKSVSLLFTETVIKDNGEQLVIKIRLGDDCKNGHQGFSVTGDLYSGAGRGDKSLISGGCIHEDILLERPQYKRFVDLHLCDYYGVHMHAVANGYYHLKSNPMTTEKFCEYYRVTEAEYNALSNSGDQHHFGYLLKELGILDRWRVEAAEAIKVLEEMCGVEFENNSVKSNYSMTVEELNNIGRLVNEGYYSSIAVEERRLKVIEETKLKKLKDLEDKFVKTLLDETKDYRKSRIAVELFGTDDNIIYYKHTKEIVMGWNKSTYSRQYSETEFKQYLDVIKEDALFSDCEISLKD
jgi:hypothetical protein